MTSRETADEDLLSCGQSPTVDDDDRWRVQRISDEIATGFAALTPVGKAVSIFGHLRQQVSAGGSRRP